MDVIEINDDDSQLESELHDNKPRKIIFCIDTSVEMCDNLKPSANTGVKDSNLYYRIETTQRFLERYVRINKMIGNTRDQYSIISLADQAEWWYDFDPDIVKLKAELELLHSQIITKYDSFDVESLFNVINSQMTDDFFYHVIVIYARPNVMPKGRKSNISEVRDSSNMTMDFIFLHDTTESVQVQGDLLKL
ncbi:hypothetical protein BD770DRAFT_410490 [Pilaira anomala]|nr:hypothetical protein BD770DRAFT_410490 [Pilaira anomala]